MTTGTGAEALHHRLPGGRLSSSDDGLRRHRHALPHARRHTTGGAGGARYTRSGAATKMRLLWVPVELSKDAP